MRLIVQGVALALFAVTPAWAWFHSASAVREAIQNQVYDINLADYSDGSVDERAELISIFIAAEGAAVEDQRYFVNCMGDFAVTKNPDLPFETVFGWCAFEAQNDREEFEAHFNELDTRDLSAEAAVLCERYVETQLRSPSTADFPWLLNTLDRGRWRYVVNSYVDAENGFGATVRTNFTCDLQYSGPAESGAYLDFRNWEMLDFQIGL